MWTRELQVLLCAKYDIDVALTVCLVCKNAVQQVGRNQVKEVYHNVRQCTISLQGLTLLMMGPALDYYIKNDWVTNYTWTSAALAALALSCGSAVAVNVSQFMCLGRFSALSYQVFVPKKGPPNV